MPLDGSDADPAAMPPKDLDAEVVFEPTGAFNSLEGGSQHYDGMDSNEDSCSDSDYIEAESVAEEQKTWLEQSDLELALLRAASAGATYDDDDTVELPEEEYERLEFAGARILLPTTRQTGTVIAAEWYEGCLQYRILFDLDGDDMPASPEEVRSWFTDQ